LYLWLLFLQGKVEQGLILFNFFFFYPWNVKKFRNEFVCTCCKHAELNVYSNCIQQNSHDLLAKTCMILEVEKLRETIKELHFYIQITTNLSFAISICFLECHTKITFIHIQMLFSNHEPLANLFKIWGNWIIFRHYFLH
jgi:hypothetical protein